MTAVAVAGEGMGRARDTQLPLAVLDYNVCILQAMRAVAISSSSSSSSSSRADTQPPRVNRRKCGHYLGVIGQVSQGHTQHLARSYVISRQNQSLTLAEARFGSRWFVAAAGAG